MGQLKHRITGMGIVSAAGGDVQAVSSRLFEGRAAADHDPSETRYFKLNSSNYLGETEFLPNGYAMKAVREALAMADLNRESLNKLRVGVVMGSTVGCTNYDEDFGRDFFGGKFPGAGILRNYFRNNSAQFLARTLDLKGPVQMLSNACTSGADAIGVAANWLDADLCDVVICGGTEVILPRVFYGFRSLLLAAPELCKPFDKDRQGLTLGEGAGILILEKSSSPRRAIGEFLGYGSASDAYHPTSPDPEGKGLDLAVQLCSRRSDFNLREIDFINAHGTGTPHNDLAEGRWIARQVPGAAVVATKAYTGHTLGAAGAMEAVITLLSLQRGQLPISLGFTNLDPQIGIAPTRVRTAGDFKKALSLSLGFGGLNAALCLGRSE